MAIEISTRKQKDVTIMGVSGEMVLGKEHFTLMKQVIQELKKTDKIVIDLGKVTKIDSAGVGELVAINMAGKEHKAQIHVANFDEHIGKVLQMALIHKIIPTYDTQKEAIGAFHE